MDTGGAVAGVDYLGDPDDRKTWIAIGTNDVTITINLYTRNYTFYRLQSSIVTQTAVVPLPATGLLLVGALGGLATLRTSRRTA